MNSDPNSPLQMEKMEHDEEALKLTGAVLTSNPDFATLFNYRRNTLLKIFAGSVETLFFTSGIEGAFAGVLKSISTQ